MARVLDGDAPHVAPHVAPRVVPLGVWLIGARGAVATTTVVGAAALGRGLIPPLGLVTAAPPFDRVPLAPLGELVFGGHDRGTAALVDGARALGGHAGPLEPRLVAAVEAELSAIDARLRPAPPRPIDMPLRAFVDAVKHDLEAFKVSTGARRVIMVNVATTEPPPSPAPFHEDASAFERALDDVRPPVEAVLPQSALYAYAALSSGVAYVNFTPSVGANLPALEALSRARGVPHAGCDGKTGETLLKSVLAPMFKMRQLEVKSWSAINLLGGGDGAALADPAIAASKIASKGGVVGAILGYQPAGAVRIDYVEPLGDWKTAWDLIQFDGFLGTRMTMQLTWQGSDSALAAPLVLDLVRLVDHAAGRGERGALGHLGFFFKSPLGSDVHDLSSQHALLCRHVCG